MSNVGISDVEGEPPKQYFLDDPLTYKGKAKIGTGLSIFEAMSFCDQHLLELDIPLYMFVGKMDQVANYEPMKIIFDNHPNEKKILHSPDNMGHYMLEDPEYAIFVKSSAEFLLSLTDN